MIEANGLIFPHPRHAQGQNHYLHHIKDNIIYIPKAVSPPQDCFCHKQQSQQYDSQSMKTTARTYNSIQPTQTIKIRSSNQIKMKMAHRKSKTILANDLRNKIEITTKTVQYQSNPILTPRTMLFHAHQQNQSKIEIDRNGPKRHFRNKFQSDDMFQPQQQDQDFQTIPIKVAKLEINNKGFMHNRRISSQLWNYRKTNQHESILNQDTFIPCLYIQGSNFYNKIIVYFHANGEDIAGCYNFLRGLSYETRYSLLAVQYPGYSIYKGKSSACSIQSDSIEVIEFLKNKIGFKQEDIMIMGRSIGSGPATFVSSIFDCKCLILLSPFLSLCEAVGDLYGSFASTLLKQRFDNKQQAKSINSPCLIIHGSKDKLISEKHTTELSQYFKGFCSTKIIKNMSHTSFNHQQLYQCVNNFLQSIHV